MHRATLSQQNNDGINGTVQFAPEIILCPGSVLLTLKDRIGRLTIQARAPRSLKLPRSSAHCTPGNKNPEKYLQMRLECCFPSLYPILPVFWLFKEQPPWSCMSVGFCWSRHLWIEDHHAYFEGAMVIHQCIKLTLPGKLGKNCLATNSCRQLSAESTASFH